MIACVVLPFLRGETQNTKCYLVRDKWQPSIHGYPSEEQCLKRVNRINASIIKNFKLFYIKKSYCKRTAYSSQHFLEQIITRKRSKDNKLNDYIE